MFLETPFSCADELTGTLVQPTMVSLAIDHSILKTTMQHSSTIPMDTISRSLTVNQTSECDFGLRINFGFGRWCLVFCCAGANC